MIRIFGYCFIVVAFVLTVAQIAVYGSKLPDPVASHFDHDGNVNSSMSKNTFLVLQVGLQLLTAMTMIGIAKLLGKLPNSMINAPNKEYWLSVENRSKFLEINETVLVAIAAITALFLVAVFQLAIQSNLNGGPLNATAFWIAITVYLGLIAGICLLFFRCLNRT